MRLASGWSGRNRVEAIPSASLTIPRARTPWRSAFSLSRSSRLSPPSPRPPPPPGVDRCPLPGHLPGRVAVARQAAPGRDDDEPRPVRANCRASTPPPRPRAWRYWEGVLRQLDGIDPAALSRAERINYAVYRAQIAAFVEAQRFREYEQPVNADSAFWTDITYMARAARSSRAGIPRLPRPAGRPAALLQRAAGQHARRPGARLHAAARDPGRPRRAAGLGRRGQGRRGHHLLHAVQGHAGDDPGRRAGAPARAGAAAIRDRVQPAHAEPWPSCASEYVPKARATLAAESLPDGKAYYQSKIVEYTTTADGRRRSTASAWPKWRRSAPRCTDDGPGRLQGRPAGLPAFLRSDPQFYAKTPDELLMRAAWIAKKFDGKADQYFGYLPRRRFAIVPGAADQAPYYTSAAAVPASTSSTPTTCRRARCTACRR
jgi:uncharacterized protein (DUF885 family)